MKRILLAVALATVTAGSIAATEYINEAGQSEIDNVVQTQISDASDTGKVVRRKQAVQLPAAGLSFTAARSKETSMTMNSLSGRGLSLLLGLLALGGCEAGQQATPGSPVVTTAQGAPPSLK